MINPVYTLMSKDSLHIEADRGSLVIGNDHLKINVPNGHGNCEMLVDVIDYDFDLSMSFHLFTSISGDFWLYSKNEKIKYVEEGRYSIYYKSGCILIMKMEK